MAVTITYVGDDSPKDRPFRLSADHDATRVTTHISLAELKQLVEDGLELLVDRSNEEETCPFCPDEDDEDAEGGCELRGVLKGALREIHRDA